MAPIRQRKTVEELYGSNKFDAPKSQVTTNISKNGRAAERDYGYIITTNSPYSNSGPTPVSAATNNVGAGLSSSRRRTARTLTKTTNDKNGKEKESFNVENLKKENNMKMKTSRAVTSAAIPNGNDTESYMEYNDTRQRDLYAAAGDSVPQYQQHSHNQQRRHHHNHQHHHQNNPHRHNQCDDEDKDDDTDEFFQLIRQTVEGAIGKAISELLNRNFRELSTKVERFSAELKNTNAFLMQIQTDVNNKIVHYGEENSRHFRHLCMKSEYDKIFYQHQSMVANTPRIPPSDVTTNGTSHNTVTPKPQKPEKRKGVPKSNITKQLKDCDKPIIPPPACSCGSNSSKTLISTDNEKPRKVSSAELSQKSSETGMREIIKQIQTFVKEIKCDAPTPSLDGNHNHGVPNYEDLININKKVFDISEDDDEDDSEISSDGMTPRCEEHYGQKYGGATVRTSNRGQNKNGAGDAL